MLKARRKNTPSLRLQIPPNMIWPIAFIAGLLVGCSAWTNAAKNISLAPSSVRACFTPGANCETEIIAAIANAEQEILVQAYSFTSENIANALLAAHKRGVSTKIIYDKKTAKEKHSQIPRLYSHGIKTIPDKVRGLQHNKLILIDHILVLTGSYNYSNGARDKNAENLVIISSPDLAKEFVANWMIRSGGK